MATRREECPEYVREYLSSMAADGGRARWRGVRKEERRAVMRAVARTRWAKGPIERAAAMEQTRLAASEAAPEAAGG